MVDRDVGALTGVPPPPAHERERISRTNSSVSNASVARTLSFTRGAKFTRGESMTLEDAHQVLDESAHAYAGSLKFAAVQLILGERLSVTGATTARVSDSTQATPPRPPPPPVMPPNLEPCTLTVNVRPRVAFDPNVDVVQEREYTAIGTVDTVTGAGTGTSAITSKQADQTHSFSRLITNTRSFMKARRREDSTLESESKPNLTLQGGGSENDSPSDHIRRTRTESPGSVFLSHQPSTTTPRKAPSFSIRTSGGGARTRPSERLEHRSRVRALLTSFRKRTNKEDNQDDEENVHPPTSASPSASEQDAAHAPAHTWKLAKNFSFRNKRPSTATAAPTAGAPTMRTSVDQVKAEINTNANANENKDEDQPRAWARALSFRSKNKRARVPKAETPAPPAPTMEPVRTNARNETTTKSRKQGDGGDDSDVKNPVPAPMHSRVEPPAYTPPREPPRSRERSPKVPDTRKVRMPGSGAVLTVDRLPIESAGRPDRQRNRDRDRDKRRKAKPLPHRMAPVVVS